MQEMVIDVGATSKEEVINQLHIHIGAPVVPDVSCTYEEERDLFYGKAFDCRIGCACVMETLAISKMMMLEVIGTISAQGRSW